jgi:hypothetical protein
MVSIFWTTILFLVLAFLFRDNLAEWSLIDSNLYLFGFLHWMPWSYHFQN